MTYSYSDVSHHMWASLLDTMSRDEADNAITALTTLTSIFPNLFPSRSTFVRADSQFSVRGPTGVRFVVYDEGQISRTVRIPRSDLLTISSAVDSVIATVSSTYG